MESLSDQINNFSAFLIIQRKVGQFTNWDTFIFSRTVWILTNLRIDFKLIFALIIKDSGVATNDFLSTKFEPSNSDQSVKFIMNIYFVDVKVFFALIDNGNPFSMDIKFENFSDDIIL